MNEKAIDQADEEVLAREVSDDALEAAADAERNVPSAIFSGPSRVSDFLLLI